MIQELNEENDDSMLDLIEEEKRIMDDKVDKSRFFFMVFKSHYYRDLIEAMKKYNEQMGVNLDKTKVKFQDLISFD